MRDVEEILPLVFGILVAIALFFGMITAVKKSLTVPVGDKDVNATIRLKEQGYRMDDVRRNQKELMRNQKQKIRDLQRR